MSISAIAFLAVFIGSMILALVRQPMYGLAMYVLVFYLHPPSRWWGELLPDLRWALLAALVTAIAAFRLPRDPYRPGWFTQVPARIFVFYTVWLWIQLAWALDTDEQLFLAVLWTKFLIVSYLIYRIVDSPEKVTWFLTAHVLGCLYLGWLAHSADYSGRLNGVGGPGIDDANSLAMQLATGVMAAAMLFFQQEGWRRWVAAVAAVVLLNTMVMTGSRSGFLALLAGGAVIWYLRPTFKRKLFYALAGVGLIGFLALASEAFWERMGTIKTAAGGASEEVEESALSRWVIMDFQIDLALKHPLGVGHRGTVVESPKYLDSRWLTKEGGRSSHNTFLTAWGEQGIPGLIVYIGFWGWVAVAAVRAKRAKGYQNSFALQAQLAALVGALAAHMVAGVFVDYARAEIPVWLAALLAVVTVLARKDGQECSLNAARPKAPTTAHKATG